MSQERSNVVVGTGASEEVVIQNIWTLELGQDIPKLTYNFLIWHILFLHVGYLFPLQRMWGHQEGGTKKVLKIYRALFELLHLLWYVGLKNKRKKDQEGRLYHYTKYCVYIQAESLHNYDSVFHRTSRTKLIMQCSFMLWEKILKTLLDCWLYCHNSTPIILSQDRMVKKKIARMVFV